MGFIMSKSKRLTYAFKDDMELYFQNASKASANMVEFAIRSIFTMEFRNPSVQVPSMVTYLGTSFDVYWKYVILLCIWIVTVQLVLSIFIYLFYVEPSKRDRAG